MKTLPLLMITISVFACQKRMGSASPGNELPTKSDALPAALTGS